MNLYHVDLLLKQDKKIFPKQNRLEYENKKMVSNRSGMISKYRTKKKQKIH